MLCVLLRVGVVTPLSPRQYPAVFELPTGKGKVQFDFGGGPRSRLTLVTLLIPRFLQFETTDGHEVPTEPGRSIIILTSQYWSVATLFEVEPDMVATLYLLTAKINLVRQASR
jgi:hypothetical protein